MKLYKKNNLLEFNEPRHYKNKLQFVLAEIPPPQNRKKSKKTKKKQYTLDVIFLILELWRR